MSAGRDGPTRPQPPHKFLHNSQYLSPCLTRRATFSSGPSLAHQSRPMQWASAGGLSFGRERNSNIIVWKEVQAGFLLVKS